MKEQNLQSVYQYKHAGVPDSYRDEGGDEGTKMGTFYYSTSNLKYLI